MPFITDNSQLNFPKTDRAALGGGRDPVNYVTGAEWNKTCQSLIDVRAWIISGSYYGFVSGATNPNVSAGLSGTCGWMWMSSSKLPYFSTTSSDGLVTKQILLTGDGGGGSASTSSLDFLTRDLTVQRTIYSSGSIFAVGVTASAGIKTSLDLEAVRNLTIGGNASFVSLTGSGGAKFLDLEITRTFSVTNLTGSSFKTNLDLESARNLLVGNRINITGFITGSDSAWTAVTFQNSWANLAGFSSAGYRKDPLGYVHVRGVINAGTPDVAAFTLPAGYRPGGKLAFAGGGGATPSTYVNTDGTVVPNSSNTAAFLDAIIFLAEN